MQIIDTCSKTAEGLRRNAAVKKSRCEVTPVCPGIRVEVPDEAPMPFRECVAPASLIKKPDQFNDWPGTVLAAFADIGCPGVGQTKPLLAGEPR